MCGIAGIVTRDSSGLVDTVRLKAMADAIAHRGPDAEGFFTQAPGVGLAHRRLSIIDLEGGNQPIGNEDGSIQIVFNGEIYNFESLRDRLINNGHSFKTNSDTETLVHLYEEYGEDLVQHLRGMFAFAIWDREKKQLLLARDHLGQKPLYYALDDNRILFGSEIKAILAHGDVSKSIDLKALEDYLAFGFVPGERSIFSSIKKLEPATTLGLSTESWEPQKKRYWKLEGNTDSDKPLQEWVENISEAFTDSVKAHRIADVPVGSFLSGGLDSSAVTGVLANMDNHPVQTFSIGFEEKKFSELEHAQVVAETFNTKHTESIVTHDAIESLAKLIKYYDEPFADASAIPTMRVAELASQQVKVALSGDGGDEAFGGYSRYSHDLRENKIRKWIPPFVRQHVLRHLASIWPKADWLPRIFRLKSTLTNLSLSPAAAYANTLCICRKPMRRQLLSSRIKKQISDYAPEQQVIATYQSGGQDSLRGMLAADTHFMLPGDFLTKVDRASMAYGLEVRPPMVDHEFLALTWSVPSKFKVKGGQTKWLFKQVCEKWLPSDIIYRKKQGFEIPIDEWLRGPLRPLFEKTVLGSDHLGHYLNLDFIRKLYTLHCNRAGRHGNVLWAILVLGAWMQHYLDEDQHLPQEN